MIVVSAKYYFPIIIQFSPAFGANTIFDQLIKFFKVYLFHNVFLSTVLNLLSIGRHILLLFLAHVAHPPPKWGPLVSNSLFSRPSLNQPLFHLHSGPFLLLSHLLAPLTSLRGLARSFLAFYSPPYSILPNHALSGGKGAIVSTYFGTVTVMISF